jgi:hypothetical protein
MNNYSSYIYIWYDIKAKFFYIGGHSGKIEDRYICSSKTMLRAYQKRPKTFKFKVLQYINGTIKDLRIAEQYWLNMIKDEELMLTKNVKNKTCRYYNVKKNAAGGNGKGTNKGKSHQAWNKGIPWWTNGIDEKQIKECPNENWFLGRKEEIRKKHSNTLIGRKKIYNNDGSWFWKKGPLFNRVEPIPQMT